VSGLAVVREVLEDLIEEYGELTPELVVEVARPADSPIHSHFEWDDSIAAELHRRGQARQLIRKVKVVYATDPEGRDRTQRAFVSVRPAGSPKRVYQRTEEVLQDPIARQLLLREFERDWLRFKARYEHLQEFWNLIRPDSEQAG
jgi:hypothetical protein